MKNDLLRFLPPAISPKKELREAAVILLAAFLFSLSFWIQYCGELNFLYAGGVLMPDTYMPAFAYLMEGKLLLFFLGAAYMLCKGIYYYMTFYHGSKSIYLMRRLPERHAVLRRCLIFPIAMTAAFLLCAAIVFLLDFGLYMLITPKRCLYPDQWQMIWEVLLHHRVHYYGV